MIHGAGIFREKNFIFLLDPPEQVCRNWQQSLEEIDAQDDRHEFLARTIKSWKPHHPVAVKLSPAIRPRVDTLVIPDLLCASGSATEAGWSVIFPGTEW